MQLFINGDNNAFNEVYKRYSKRVLYFMYKMLNNDEEKAQDLLQDLFLKIVEQPSRFDVSRRLKPWIFAIAANLCKSSYRNVKNNHIHIDDMEIEDFNNSDQTIVSNMDFASFRSQLKIELNKLSTDHKEVFILRYHEKFSVKEIAATVGCSEGTVKSRIHYSIKKMANNLSIFHSISTN